MHRFYLPPEQVTGAIISLTDREAHHASQVLRLQPGEVVTVLNGVGNEIACQVAAVAKKKVDLSVTAKQFVAPLPFSLTLIQAIPKGKMFEWIIEKATELGVTRIVPLLTERVVIHLDDDAATDKQEKWQQVAVEAIKQCGQPWLPQVEKPISLKNFLSRHEQPELSLVGSLQAGSRHPAEFFRKFREQEKRFPKTVSVFVGPEGDFTVKEIEQIQSSGASPITLGRLVLRCETAAIYCLSIVNYESGRAE